MDVSGFEHAPPSLKSWIRPCPLSRLLCTQWKLSWHNCWQQHETSDAAAVSLHPGQQVVWMSNPLQKPDWFWERILLASFYAWCLYFLFLLQCLSLELYLSSNLQNGNTALHVACVRGHDSVVKLLIDANADLGIANKVSITKPIALVPARIPMQHIEPLCNAYTDRYASYGINSLPSSFSITTFLPSPFPSPVPLAMPTVTTLVVLLLAAAWHFWCFTSVITSWSASCLGVKSSTETRLVLAKDIVSLFPCWMPVLSILYTVFEFGFLFVLWLTEWEYCTPCSVC